jgi:hypothetical protein
MPVLSRHLVFLSHTSQGKASADALGKALHSASAGLAEPEA